MSLEGETILLVGGYGKVRKRVIEFLRSEYNLENFYEVPPPWEGMGTAYSNIPDYLKRSTLVVVIANCVKHSTTEAVDNWLGKMDCPPSVVYPIGKGQSSIIMEVEKFFRENTRI